MQSLQQGSQREKKESKRERIGESKRARERESKQRERERESTKRDREKESIRDRERESKRERERESKREREPEVEVTPLPLPQEKEEEEDTTTDEEGETPVSQTRWQSIKFPQETWVDKATARQLKSFLRDNYKLRNRSFSRDYVLAFVEAAHISSRFTTIADKDRAMDEVFSLFEEWSELQVNQKFSEFSGQTLLNLLTSLGLPEWMSRIFYKSIPYDYLVNQTTKLKVEQQRNFLLSTPDDLGNVFAHYLLEYISKHPQDGMYFFTLVMQDPLWFKFVSVKLKASLNQKNKSGSTPLQSLDPQFYLTLFNFGSKDFQNFFSKENQSQLDKELEYDMRKLHRLGSSNTST